jgi:hypothetical protein
MPEHTFSRTIAERRPRRVCQGAFVMACDEQADAGGRNQSAYGADADPMTSDDDDDDDDPTGSSTDPLYPPRSEGGRRTKSRRTSLAGATRRDDGYLPRASALASDVDDATDAGRAGKPLTRVELKTIVLFRIRLIGMNENGLAINTLSEETLTWMCGELGVDCKKLAAI